MTSHHGVNSNPPKDMNTSKSLDLRGQLNTIIYEVTDSDDVVKQLADLLVPFITKREQAIVEAVEGLIPYGYGDKVEGSGTAAANMRGFNECRDLVLEAIKEWQ